MRHCSFLRAGVVYFDTLEIRNSIHASKDFTNFEILDN